MTNPAEQKKGRITPTQFIVLAYVAAVILSTGILMLPVSVKPGVSLSPGDAFFTAASAVSVTGLTSVNTAETYSLFGTIALIVMFQFGGIGIMALGTFIYLILGRNISLSYRRLIAIDQNRRNQLAGLVQLIRALMALTVLIELVGALILGTYFYLTGLVNDLPSAYYHGLFHAVSAFTNAGFDLFGDSMRTFARDYFVQLVTMALLFLGAIGFPVLLEAREWLSRKHPNFRFSLFTKLTTVTFLVLILAGAIGIFWMERDLYMADEPWHAKLFHSLFSSVTARSGGFSTVDMGQYSAPAQLLLSILMFIGASPSSVGGGIRTTTFAVIVLAIWSFARGKSEVRVFRRAIKQEDVLRSFVVFSVAVFLVALVIILVDVNEQHRFTLSSVIFEVCSAFGSSGLSTGITAELSPLSKSLLAVLMVIGRIGILTMLLSFRTDNRTETIRYPKEDVLIG
jgi:potassium uptake TrkH family protein